MAQNPIKGLKGLNKLMSDLVGQNMVKEVGKALYHGGETIQAYAQISITAGSVSGKGHVPSVHPNPPNNDTGVLAGNIETKQVAPLVVEVSSNAPYAAVLEIGNSRIESRKYMEPARNANADYVQEVVSKAVVRVIKKAGK